MVGRWGRGTGRRLSAPQPRQEPSVSAISVGGFGTENRAKRLGRFTRWPGYDPKPRWVGIAESERRKVPSKGGLLGRDRCSSAVFIPLDRPAGVF